MVRAGSLSSGTILEGRYRVDEPVGEGGFATVYSGHHLTLGVRVAIKVLHLEGDGERDADRLVDFLEEAKLVTRLRHDHIVRTLDQGIVRSDDGRSVPYVVLEWCGEESLAERLKREPRLPLREAYGIVDAITDAMAHAHENGVAHRDLKPSNVMLSQGANGELVPRVIDFGVAKVFETASPGSGETATQNQGRYTPAYAAPEQIAGTRTGPYTDVHAIGLLFHELVTGRPPFSGDAALGNVDPERPTPARVGVDVGPFEAVIARAVALRPADRYENAAALGKALKKAARTADWDSAESAPASHEPNPQSVETGPATSHATRTQASKRRSALPFAFAVVALSGALVYTMMSRKNAPADPASQPPAPIEVHSVVTTTSSAPSVTAAPPQEKTSADKPVAASAKPNKWNAGSAGSAAVKQEAPHAPSASSPEPSQGVGGIVETPPF